MGTQRVPIRLTLLHAIAAITSLAFLLGLLGRYWWLCDLIVHFQHLYLLTLIPPLLLFLALRAWRHALVYLPVLVYGLVLVLPYAGLGSRVIGAGGQGLKVVTLNLNSQNRSTGLVLEFVRGWQPDLLVLEEYNWYWKNELEPLRVNYPYYWSAPRQDNFGIAIYSRYPLREMQTLYSGQASVPVLTGCVEVHGRQLSLMAAHTLPPISHFYSRLRDEQFLTMAELAARQDRPLLVVGDLNNTVWSHSFQDFLKRASLKATASECGMIATWPSALPIVQIDHALVSPDLGVKGCWRGSEVGSDHRPLVTELLIR